MRSVAWFKYGTFDSQGYALEIENTIEFPSPEKDVEYIKVAGRSGEVAITDGTYKNVDYNIDCVVRTHLGDTPYFAQELGKFKTPNTWQDLTFSWDSDYIYKGLITDKWEWERKSDQLHKVTIPIKVKPFKYTKAGQAEISTATVTNPTKFTADPSITITGSGNMVIDFWGVQHTFSGVSGGLVIDTENQVVYDLSGKVAWDKIKTYPLPKIPTGTSNYRVVSGTATVKYRPNFKTLV